MIGASCYSAKSPLHDAGLRRIAEAMDEAAIREPGLFRAGVVTEADAESLAQCDHHPSLEEAAW